MTPGFASLREGERKRGRVGREGEEKRGGREKQRGRKSHKPSKRGLANSSLVAEGHKELTSSFAPNIQRVSLMLISKLRSQVCKVWYECYLGGLPESGRW